MVLFLRKKKNKQKKENNNQENQVCICIIWSQDFLNNEFYHFCTVFTFYFLLCVITLICDTNVKYFNTLIFEGGLKVFLFYV